MFRATVAEGRGAWRRNKESPYKADGTIDTDVLHYR